MLSFNKGIYLVPVCLILVNCGGGGGGETSSNAIVERTNVAPQARIDSATEIDIETPLVLDASGSSDSDGDLLTYEWKLVNSPNSAEVFIENHTSSLTRIVVDTYGEYDFSLTVFDGKVYSEARTITVTAKKMPIDCNKLNPGKVYLQGMLDHDHRYNAIADPTDPTDFCVGFHASTYEGRVADSGRLIYADENEEGFFAFKTDSLTKDENNFWVYPSNFIENDSLLHIPNTDGCGLLNMYLIPDTEEVLYSCPNAWYHTFSEYRYFFNDDGRDNSVLAVLPDRSIVAYHQTEGLKYIDAQKNESLIQYDFELGAHIFAGSRQFIDEDSGDRMLWLNHFRYLGEQREFKRITVNLDTLAIIQDQPYENVTNLYSASNNADKYVLLIDSGKYDLQGNFWVRAWRRGTDSYLILKIPPVSTGKSASVIYNSDDYQNTEIYIGPTESCIDFPFLELCDDGTYRWERHENNVVKIGNFSRLITSY